MIGKGIKTGTYSPAVHSLAASQSGAEATAALGQRTFDDLPHPGLLPREKETLLLRLGKVQCWIGRTNNRTAGSLQGRVLSPGERIQVRTSVKTTPFHWLHGIGFWAYIKP